MEKQVLSPSRSLLLENQMNCTALPSQTYAIDCPFLCSEIQWT